MSALYNTMYDLLLLVLFPRGRGEGVLPHMGYIGMCRCEGYGFQAVYCGIGYTKKREFGSAIGYHFPGN